MTDFETLLYTESDGVAWVTLNRPDVLNSFDNTMRTELKGLWRSLRSNDDVRSQSCSPAPVSGRSASASTAAPRTPTSIFEQDTFYGTSNNYMYDDPGEDIGPKANDLWKPVICAVNGMACGGAFYMLAECDIIIAAEHATFFDPHVTYGQAAVYEPMKLLQHISLGNVMRLSLLGSHERISAATALQIGLVTEVGARRRAARAGGLAGRCGGERARQRLVRHDACGVGRQRPRPARRPVDGAVDPVDRHRQGRHEGRQRGVREPAPDQAAHPLTPALRRLSGTEGGTVGIKLFAFGRRREGVTTEEFHRWWEDVHARGLADEPTLRRHVRRYELNHRLAEDYVRDRYRPEGTAAGLGRRGRAVVRLARRPRGPAGRAGLGGPRRRRRRLFRDDAQLVVITHDPEVIVDKPGRADAGAKMVCILRRNPALDLPTFHEHWLHHHGGLFQRIPELNEPLLAYDQNHGIDLPDADYDGVTEQWFTSYATFLESLGVEAVQTEVNPDVAYFLDQSSIEFVMAGPPTVVVDKAGDFGGTWYWNRYPGAACDIEVVHLHAVARRDWLHPGRAVVGQPEIFEHCRVSAADGSLPRTHFQTEVTECAGRSRTVAGSSPPIAATC